MPEGAIDKSVIKISFAFESSSLIGRRGEGDSRF